MQMIVLLNYILKYLVVTMLKFSWSPTSGLSLQEQAPDPHEIYYTPRKPRLSKTPQAAPHLRVFQIAVQPTSTYPPAPPTNSISCQDAEICSLKEGRERLCVYFADSVLDYS